MITLSILLLVLYAISIKKLKEANWDVLSVDMPWGIISFFGTVLLIFVLIVLIVTYLP